MKKRLDIKKTVVLIVVINIVQIAALAASVLYISLYSRNRSSFMLADGYIFIFIIAATSFINSFISIKDLYLLIRTDSQYHSLEETLSKLEGLNTTLRAQRHDFLNHLQVVHGLMEMDEFNDAKEYIERIYDDIQRVGRVLRTSNPAVNALLQAKTLDAEKRGINTVLDVKTQLNGLTAPSWEFCRILANIIDNAIYALEQIESSKYLKIELFEDLKQFVFRVSDNGAFIPVELHDRIFEPGFTTKGAKGEGMGLSISKSIMEEYGGTIKVYSTQAETTFEGILPRQVQ